MSPVRSLRIARLSECTLDQVAELKNRGFEGYKEQFLQAKEPHPGQTVEQVLAYLVKHGIRPALSVVAFVHELPVGFVFFAVKTVGGQKLAWNGGTGVSPEFRGEGIAKAMMREGVRMLREEQVDLAFLEVVVQNEHAIAAYENAGFRKADKLVGMRNENGLKRMFEVDPGARLSFRYGRSADVAELPFYREQTAWVCMWHGVADGQSLIVYDEHLEPAGYALFRRQTNAEGDPEAVELLQCEARDAGEQAEGCIRLLLHEIFGPPGTACLRKVTNLSMSSPAVVRLLQEAGFITQYEQYLMVTGRKKT